MAPTIEELEGMSNAELRRRYNETAQHTTVGLEWHRHDLLRRDVARQTRWLIVLTFVITVATVLLLLLEVL